MANRFRVPGPPLYVGLTVAAGFLGREAEQKITIFERYDTVLPLQQGSDV
jgi:hypothetical protein